MLAHASDAPPAISRDRDSSIDDLDRAIVTLAARLNAVTHDFLILVRRFDERAGWLGWGFESCADWLHWRCDISLSAAREKVRVAHALKVLPTIAMAFAEGQLSYSKVRALTRVARRENEDALLEFALRTTAARVEERCRELRCGTVDSTDEVMRAHARRTLSLRRDPERGTITITVELPLETGELVDKALDQAMETTASSAPELAEESWAAQRADAFVAMAKAYLGGSGEDAASVATGTADHYQVVVHVDESALRGGAGRAGLPIESLKRIGCDASRLFLVEDEHGDPLSVGRKTRVVPQAIKRALWARDGGCRFPGCGRRRFVDAHHIEHWSTGGETSLANLMLLCSKHHTLVHEGGFRIEKDYRDRWFFRRPDGRAVPACGYRASDMQDDEVATEVDYFAARRSAHSSDNPSVRPSAEGSRVAEPSAGLYRVIGPSRRSFRPARSVSFQAMVDTVISVPAAKHVDPRPSRSSKLVHIDRHSAVRRQQ
jgi:hypothetical protein